MKMKIVKKKNESRDLQKRFDKTNKTAEMAMKLRTHERLWTEMTTKLSASSSEMRPK